MHSKTLTNTFFFIIFIVLALCPLSWAFRTTGDLPHSDSFDHVETAYILYQEFGAGQKAQESKKISSYREPLYPAFLALYFYLSKDENFIAQGFECFRQKNLCPETVRNSKLVNWLFHCLSTIAVGIAVMGFTRRRRYALLAMTTISLNTAMITGVNTWMSEPQAIFFLLVHSVALWSVFNARRPWVAAIISGLSLAALIFTKAVYFYLLPIYAVALLPLSLSAFGLLSLSLKGERLRQRAKTVLLSFTLMLALAAAIIIPIQTSKSGDNSKEFKRAEIVMAIRAEYDLMPWSDIPVALLWFTPEIGQDLTERIFGIDAAARFDRQAPDSYYRRVKKGRGAAYEMSKSENISLKKSAIRVMLGNAIKHIVLTPVFAYQGLFIPKKIAENNNRFFPSKIITQIANNLVLPFCLYGCFYFIRRRQYHWLILAVPAIYSIGIHSVLTHFWPRYSLPFLGIGLVFVFILWHSMKQSRNKEAQ